MLPSYGEIVIIPTIRQDHYISGITNYFYVDSIFEKGVGGVENNMMSD
jgi:hypothetical protein